MTIDEAVAAIVTDTEFWLENLRLMRKSWEENHGVGGCCSDIFQKKVMQLTQFEIGIERSDMVRAIHDATAPIYTELMHIVTSGG